MDFNFSTVLSSKFCSPKARPCRLLRNQFMALGMTRKQQAPRAGFIRGQLFLYVWLPRVQWLTSEGVIVISRVCSVGIGLGGKSVLGEWFAPSILTSLQLTHSVQGPCNSSSDPVWAVTWSDKGVLAMEAGRMQESLDLGSFGSQSPLLYCLE